ncbi:hypothetical protein PT974_07974 [Cladobotryum mycophilum]|uniref:Uncharacterized protein n=1 Tax=Cladobotryum mycophilum TaxID=491253 RepID=A0ABR0SD47_9HYPO
MAADPLATVYSKPDYQGASFGITIIGECVAVSERAEFYYGARSIQMNTPLYCFLYLEPDCTGTQHVPLTSSRPYLGPMVRGVLCFQRA